jgi:hypothetical protein
MSKVLHDSGALTGSQPWKHRTLSRELPLLVGFQSHQRSKCRLLLRKTQLFAAYGIVFGDSATPHRVVSSITTDSPANRRPFSRAWSSYRPIQCSPSMNLFCIDSPVVYQPIRPQDSQSLATMTAPIQSIRRSRRTKSWAYSRSKPKSRVTSCRNDKG